MFKKVFPRITFIIGHDKYNQGATSKYGDTEYAYWSEVLAPFRRRKNIYVLTRNNGGKIGAHEKAAEILSDIVLEMHFNAFDKKVCGSQVLYGLNNNFELATIVNQVAVDVFMNKDRGIKKVVNGDRGFINLKGRKNTVLCEPFFGDSSDCANKVKATYYIEELIEVITERFYK